MSEKGAEADIEPGRLNVAEVQYPTCLASVKPIR
jgi:hypothetical protein